MTPQNLKTYVSVTLLAMLLVSLAGGMAPAFAAADNAGSGEGRNWELMIGGGGFYAPQYTGSDKLAFEPFPVVMASYVTPLLTFFIEADKAGMGVKFGDRVPVVLSFGVGLGKGRDNSDADILHGTPTIKNSYRLFGKVALDMPFAELSTTVNYVPITADYDEADRPKQEYTGMLVDAAIEKEWFRIPFMVQVGSGISWMDNDYAEANYSVKYTTDRLSTFTAESGLHSANLSAMLIMFFSERMGIGLMLDGKYLLNDAADSPLTQHAFVPSVGAFAFFRF